MILRTGLVPCLALAGLLSCEALGAAQITLPTNTNVAAGGSVTISISYLQQGSSVSALQFDLLYNTGSLSLTAVTGAAASAAGKSINVSPVSGGSRFLVAGINRNVINDGSIADVTIQAAASATGVYTLAFGPVIASDPNVNPVSVSAAGGTITVVAGCVFSINPGTVNVGNGSGTTGVSLTGTFTLHASGCTAANTWTAVSDSPRLLVTSGASGNGASSSSVIGYFMYTNSTTQSRTAHINVAGQTFTVTQTGSTENQGQRVVRALYQTILGREPDAGGWSFWTGPGVPVSAGGAPLYNQMADGFYTSPEFRNSGFAVLSIYQAVTNQLPTFAQWFDGVTKLRQGTQSAIQLTDLLAGSMPSSAFISQTHLYACGHYPTSTELAAWTAALTNGTYTSKFDYLNRVTFLDADFMVRTNPLFLMGMYFTILLRDPDAGGFAFWNSVLTNPPGMAGIYYIYLVPAQSYAIKLAIIGQAVSPDPNLLGFLGSPEFQALIR